MRKKYIFLTAFLIISLIGLTSFCTKVPEQDNTSELTQPKSEKIEHQAGRRNKAQGFKIPETGLKTKIETINSNQVCCQYKDYA